MANPGEIAFRFLVNGRVSAGQVNLSADLLPVFKLLGAQGQISVVNFQTAAGGIVPPPPTPVAPVCPVVPVVTPSSGAVGTLFTAAPGTWTGTPAPTLTGRWQFNGMDIVGATGYSHTSTSGDVGASKLRFVEHGANSAGSADANSLAVTVTAGSSDIPIANNAALNAMLAAGTGASGNKSYQLAPGVYNDNYWTYDYSTAPIVIKGQAGITFNSLALVSCKGISLFGNGATVTSLYSGNYAIYIISSVGITIDGFVLSGNNPGAIHSGVGIFRRDSDQITISNNSISQYGAGIAGQDCTNCNNTSNHISKCSANFMLENSTKNVVHEKNYLSNLDFSDGSHLNYIHIFSSGSTGTSTGIIIRYNNIEQPPGIPTDGFVIGLEYVANAMCITNCCFGGGANGITVIGSSDVLVDDNFSQGYSDAPRIYCRDGGNNVSLTNNLCAIAPFALTPNPPTNVTIAGNTLIPSASNSSDTSRRDTYLSTRPNIPTS